MNLVFLYPFKLWLKNLRALRGSVQKEFGRGVLLQGQGRLLISQERAPLVAGSGLVGQKEMDGLGKGAHFA